MSSLDCFELSYADLMVAITPDGTVVKYSLSALFALETSSSTFLNVQKCLFPTEKMTLGF